MDSSLVGYDGARNVRDEELSVGRKKLVRKAEPPSRRGIAWPRWTGFRGMTVRDWLELLIVPLALVVISFLFTAQQDQRQQEIENQRAAAERRLAEQRAQDEVLQAYFSQMSTLLLDKDLRASEVGSEVRTLARARTLSVLGSLDVSREATALDFLQEADLVQKVEARKPIISLEDADLRGANLFQADLRGANLHFAELSSADLDTASLNDANLTYAYLTLADLSGADLSNANLFRADLSNANLRYAFMAGTDLIAADLSNADLSNASLSNADLYGADLSNADLSNADLQGIAPEPFADLSEADLSGANLEGANATEKQLAKCQSLKGATMPNGQKYEDWIKSTTKEFEPGFRYEAGVEWESTPPETSREVIMQTGPKGGRLIFTNPRHVFDPTNLSEPKELPAPKSTEEWVSWLQSHPNLDTSKPLPVSVGGAYGKRIDVRASSTLENYPRKLCGEQPCVPLYTSGEYAYMSFDGWKNRFIIADVGNETVVIDVAARAEKFDEFLPKAQKVLDSVEWKGENSGPS